MTKTGGGGIGIPIGNLTSQIFANIYLNEFDRFVKHTLKAKAYVRYGDDFIIVERDVKKLRGFKTHAVEFLRSELKLATNSKSDKIFKVSYGLKFLGVQLWPNSRRLNKRNRRRIGQRLNISNAASYRGLVFQHGSLKTGKEFHWLLCQELADYF